MKSKIQKILENANEESGDDTFSCRSYSGRFMYGRNCLGVVVDNDSIGQLFAELVRGAPESEWERDDLIREIESFRMDNMGLDTVIYFTRAEYTEHDEDEEDEEEEAPAAE